MNLINTTLSPERQTHKLHDERQPRLANKAFSRFQAFVEHVQSLAVEGGDLADEIGIRLAVALQKTLLEHAVGLDDIADLAAIVAHDVGTSGRLAQIGAVGGHGFGGWVARPGHRRQGEFGWSGAAGTQGWIDPERNFAAVMMIQVFPYAAVPIIAEVRAAIDADLGIVRAV